MKYVSLITLFIICVSTSFAQDSIMTNKIEYQQIIALPSFQLTSNTNEILKNIDEEWLTNAKKAINNYDLIIVLGTWCSDSQEKVPEFLNLLNILEYPANEVQLYGLDEAKTSEIGIEKDYNIQFVPTFIFIDKATKKESYRIVEHFEDQNIIKSFSKALLDNK